MNTVNDEIRDAIILALRRRKMTRKQLAKQAGLSYGYVCNLLAGNAEGGREAWEAMFQVLGLGLTVKPKGE